jgi:hypothetical protein
VDAGTATVPTQKSDVEPTTGSATGTSSGSVTGSPAGSAGGSSGGSASGSQAGTSTGTATDTSGGGGGGPPRERTFWDRGGRTLLLGLGILALGVATVLTGGGALILFAGGMAIGAGAATALASGALLTGSYTGHTSAEEDRRYSAALSDAAMVASSPGSAIGGGIGYAVNGREGMKKGALIGGLSEGVLSLGVAGIRAAGMARAGPGLAEPLGEVTLQQWRQMSTQQRTLYEWGQLAVRRGPWTEIVKRGIQGNPIEKGRYLFEAGGRLGRFGIVLRAWNPLKLPSLMGTGGTPMGAYVGSWALSGAKAMAAPGAGYASSALSQ